jgi:hypothetical protein
MDAPLESSLFRTTAQVVRAQITTTGVKPCTYFATLEETGKRVFVKGPFPSVQEAQVAALNTQLRRVLAPSLPALDVQVREVRADMFGAHTALGARTKLQGQQCAIQIVECVLQGPEDLPTTFRTTAKAWKEPTEVVDWSQISKEEYSHFVFTKKYEDSIYFKNPTMGAQLATHILLSWVQGAGGDLAFRNFIFAHAHSKVYQVDLDTFMNTSWTLGKGQICSARTAAGAHFRRFLTGKFFSFIFTFRLFQNTGYFLGKH